MDHQVGDQCGRRHEIGVARRCRRREGGPRQPLRRRLVERVALALRFRCVVQRRAEAPAGELDDVEPRPLQRDADHLELARAGGTRQLQFARRLDAVQDRAPARSRTIATAVLPGTPHPGDQFARARCIHAQDAPVGTFGAAGRVEVAHGHRQQGAGIGFHQAEARRKADQWRILVGTHGERKASGILEQAPGIVAQPRRQFDRERGVLGERPPELHPFDHRVAPAGAQPSGERRPPAADPIAEAGVGRRRGLRCGVGGHAGAAPPLARARLAFQHRLVAASIGPAQRHRLRHRGRDRRGEQHAHRQHRDALRRLVGPGAAEPRAERRPGAEREHLFVGRGNTLGRLDAAAPDQPHVAVAGQLAAAAHQQPARARVAAGQRRVECLEPVGVDLTDRPGCAAREDRRTQAAGDDAHRDALVDAIGRAVGTGKHAGRGGLRIEREHEHLVFTDRVGARTRCHRDDRRATGGESGLARCLDRRTGQRALSVAQREAALQPAGQRALEVVGPGAIVDPAAATGNRAGSVHRIGEPRIAERHHRLREAGRELADILHRAGRSRHYRNRPRSRLRSGRNRLLLRHRPGRALPAARYGQHRAGQHGKSQPARPEKSSPRQECHPASLIGAGRQSDVRVYRSRFDRGACGHRHLLATYQR